MKQLNQKTIWDQYALAYNTLLPYSTLYQESIQKAIMDVAFVKSVIEIGTGPGIILERLGKLIPDVIGIEFNETMYHYARRRSYLRGNIDLRHGDGERVVLRGHHNTLNSDLIEIPPRDGCVLHNVLYNIPHPIRLLKNALNYLTPGGVISITGPTPLFQPVEIVKTLAADLKQEKLFEQYRELYEIILKSNQDLTDQGILNPFTHQSLQKLLLEIGFDQIIRSETVYHGQSYSIAAIKKPEADSDFTKIPFIWRGVKLGKKIGSHTKSLRFGQYQLGIAQSIEEFVEIFKLRITGYSRENLYRSGHTDRYDFDPYDGQSIQCYIKDLKIGKIVGTIRIILDRGKLYVEDLRDLSPLRSKGYTLGETSRLVMHPPKQVVLHNGRQLRLVDLLLNYTNNVGYHLGLSHLVAYGRSKLLPFFETHGYHRIDHDEQTLSEGKINPGEKLSFIVAKTRPEFRI